MRKLVTVLQYSLAGSASVPRADFATENARKLRKPGNFVYQQARVQSIYWRLCF